MKIPKMFFLFLLNTPKLLYEANDAECIFAFRNKQINTNLKD